MCLQIYSWCSPCINSKGFRKWIQDVFDEFLQLAIHPWSIRDDEAEAVFVVGEIDGDEEVTLLRDAFPVDVQQGAAVPDLVEFPVDVALLDQDRVSIPVGVVGMTLPGVVGDEPLDEVFDGGICGIGGREFCEVFGGFESDHIWGPP